MINIFKQHLLMPFKFSDIFHEFRNKKFNFLDIGCGNHSPSQTKLFFPNCNYYGFDREKYNISKEDTVLMEKFYIGDLDDLASLDSVPNNFFEVIVVAHVIEHIKFGEQVLQKLSLKLKKGGVMFIEWPSSRSLALPSMRGTLNFSDDKTHIRLYDLISVANLLIETGCRVEKGGRRRYLRRILLMPLVFLKNLHAPAGAFWDLLGFSDYILVRKTTTTLIDD